MYRKPFGAKVIASDTNLRRGFLNSHRGKRSR
jgi:hypothetical protein